MVECHHRLKGHEFEQTLGDSEGQGSLDSEGRGSLDSEGQGSLDSEGQGSLACCNPWAHKELDMT